MEPGYNKMNICEKLIIHHFQNKDRDPCLHLFYNYRNFVCGTNRFKYILPSCDPNYDRLAIKGILEPTKKIYIIFELWNNKIFPPDISSEIQIICYDLYILKFISTPHTIELKQKILEIVKFNLQKSFI